MIARKRRPSATGASRAKSAAGSKAAGKSPDEKQARLKELKASLHAVGLKPAQASPIFCVSGAQAYAISPQQLVSVAGVLNHLDDRFAEERAAILAKWDAARHAHNRPRLRLNAGHPTPSRPWLGECFKTAPPSSKSNEREPHAFEADWDELREKTLSSSNGVAPFDVDFPHSDSPPFYSNADVIARYAGHRALTAPGGATLFTTLFINAGEREIADVPGDDCGLEKKQQYLSQKARFEYEISKLWLLYPDRVEPACDARGNAYALGEFEAANAAARVPERLKVPYVNKRAGIDCPDVQGTEYETIGAPVLVAFATLLSDKAPGAPGNNIAGYHDRSRAWVLPPAHVTKLRKLVQHFGLEARFPALAHISGTRLTGTLPMDYHRKAAQEDLGEPPAALTDALEFDGEWRERRLGLLFQKPWVQQCTSQHPGGEVDEAGQPVLVPLIKDGCEERNGSPWLDAEALLPPGAASEAGKDVLQHYDDLQTALCSLVGRKYTPKHHKRMLSDEGDAAADQQELKRLRKQVETLKYARDHWRRLFYDAQEVLEKEFKKLEEDDDEDDDEDDEEEDDSAPGWGEVTDEDEV
jgi:hypothetical protein